MVSPTIPLIGVVFGGYNAALGAATAAVLCCAWSTQSVFGTALPPLARPRPSLTATTTATHGIRYTHRHPHTPLPPQALPKAVALLGVGAGLSLMVLVALLTWFTVHGGREGDICVKPGAACSSCPGPTYSHGRHGCLTRFVLVLVARAKRAVTTHYTTVAVRLSLFYRYFVPHLPPWHPGIVYASDRTRSATYSHVVRSALGPLPEMVLQVGGRRGAGGAGCSRRATKYVKPRAFVPAQEGG